jgi:stage IV sporulation protein FB
VIFYFLYERNPDLEVVGIPFDEIGLLFIFLNLINLFPVYPLDGGQLLNRIFFNEESWLSKGFIVLSILFLCWLAIFGMSRPFYPLLIFPAMMLFRLRGDSQFNAAEKKIEEQGINADTSYEELPDEDYWRIRNILIEQHPAFKDIPPTPPYEYSPKEEKVMTTIQSLLHRHLLQDISIPGKILIFIIWAAGLTAPWLLNIDMTFFHRFGF